MNRISTEQPTAPPALVETLRGHLGRRVAAEVLALVLAVLALASVWAMLRPLALLLAGGIIAAAVAPIVQRLERRLPRVAAVLLVYLAFLVLAGGLVALAVPTLTAQSRSLLTGSPALIDRAQQWLQQRGPAPLLPDQAAAALSSTIDRLSSALIALPLAVVSAATEALVVAVMSIYWLLAAPSLHRFLLSLLRARKARGR